MADQGSPKIKQALSPSDIPGLELTPIFGNRFNVTMSGVTTRIAIGEFVAGNPETDTNFHTALVVPTADALALAQLLKALFDTNPQTQAIQKALSGQSVAGAALGKADHGRSN